MVLTASDLNNADGEEALATLCKEYWFPLYAFIRRKGHSPEDAEDLLQAYFEQLLAKGYLSKADRERGKFRTFMLTALEHFLGNNAKAQRREKRGGKFSFVSLDNAEGLYRDEPADRHTPESIFNRQWALAILQNAMDTLRKEYVQTGRQGLFETVCPFLTEPSEAPPLAALAKKLEMTEGALRVAIHRLRRHYGDVIRKEIADTVEDPSEIDAEVRHLREAVAG